MLNNYMFIVYINVLVVYCIYIIIALNNIFLKILFMSKLITKSTNYLKI